MDVLKTLHYFKTHHILLPRHQTSGLRKGELLWKEPTESIAVDILHNPAYAGAFCPRRPCQTHDQAGAPRAGEALLQGLICCGMCGYRMRVAYKPQVRYLCDGLKRHYHEKMCMSLDDPSIEEVVVKAFFDALRPA